MTILYLILSAIISYNCAAYIKKYKFYLYFTSVLLSIFTVYMVWTDKAWELPKIWELLFCGLTLGGLGVSLILIVMFVGALPDKSEYRRRILKIRAELSIIGSILIFGHNVSFAKYYVPNFFIAQEKLWTSSLLAAYISCVMILLLLILFITSFKFVRKRMQAKTWKRIQKLAYIFVMLIYFHVLAVFGPELGHGPNWYTKMTLVVYIVVYFSYVYLKLLKEKGKKFAICGVILLLISTIAIILWGIDADKKWTSLSRTKGIDVVNTDKLLAEDYKDGTYIGIGRGKVDDIKVQIDIKNNQIIYVEIIENSEQEDSEQDWNAIYWAVHKILPELIRNQTLDIDNVEGATITCIGIKEAVQDALNQAK